MQRLPDEFVIPYWTLCDWFNYTTIYSAECTYPLSAPTIRVEGEPCLRVMVVKSAMHGTGLIKLDGCRAQVDKRVKYSQADMQQAEDFLLAQTIPEGLDAKGIRNFQFRIPKKWTIEREAFDFPRLYRILSNRSQPNTLTFLKNEKRLKRLVPFNSEVPDIIERAHNEGHQGRDAALSHVLDAYYIPEHVIF